MKVSTTYLRLLQKICKQHPQRDEVARLRRICKSAPEAIVAFTAHDTLHQMVREGLLTLRSGDLDRIGGHIQAADQNQGELYTLPALVTKQSPVLSVPLNPSQIIAPTYTSTEVPMLFDDQSAGCLTSVERSADVKGIVSSMLDRMRLLLDVPAALCFSQTLPTPSGIGRGLQFILNPGGGAISGRDAGDRTRKLVASWESWVNESLQKSDALLYLPDLSILPEPERPINQGSALVIPLQNGDNNWDAVFIALAREPYWFTREKLARIAMYAAHFRRQLSYSVSLQTAIAFDFLTDVYNRRYVEDLMKRILADAIRRDLTFAVVIIDIDDFKAFNSRFGYDAGDAVLCSVSKKLKQALRDTDVLGRYGGEEFAAILAPPVSKLEASNIGERLREAVANMKVEVPTLSGSQEQVGVSVSIGGALFPGNGQTRDDLWNEANLMLLSAKNEGKNCVRFPWSSSGTDQILVLPGPGSAH